MCWSAAETGQITVQQSSMLFLSNFVSFFFSLHTGPKLFLFFLYSCPHYLLPLISILAYRSASPTWLLISCLQCPPFFFFIFRWKNHHNLKSLDFIWSKERNKHKRSIYTFGHCWPVSLIATKETTQFLYERNNIINREYETSPPHHHHHQNI